MLVHTGPWEAAPYPSLTAALSEEGLCRHRDRTALQPDTLSLNCCFPDWFPFSSALDLKDAGWAALSPAPDLIHMAHASPVEMTVPRLHDRSGANTGQGPRRATLPWPDLSAWCWGFGGALDIHVVNAQIQVEKGTVTVSS